MLTLVHVKIFPKFFFSLTFVALLIFGNDAQACTRNSVDEVLSLNCQLRFIAGKLVQAETVENLNLILRRNGYPALWGSHPYSYHDVSYSVSPAIAYDPNLNGGNPAKNLQVGSLEFISDPNHFKVEGIAAGLSLIANGRYASTNNIIADVNASYTYKKSIDYSHFEIDQVSVEGCLKKHIAAWNIGNFCINKGTERRFLSQYESMSLSFTQQFYGEFKGNPSMLGYKFTSETNGYEFNRASFNVQTIDFTGKGFNFEIGAGQSRIMSSVRDYNANLQFSGNHYYLKSVGLMFKISELPPLLGVKRQDKKSTLEATLSLSQNVTLQIGYEISNSSIDYFDTEYPFITIRLSH